MLGKFCLQTFGDVLAHFVVLYRYSGELSEIGVRIDEVANGIWDSVSIFPSLFIVNLLLAEQSWLEFG